MGTTKSLGSKHILDKFYTDPELAKELIELLDVDKYTTVIEPSAGGGAFSRWIPGVLAFDIEPEYEGIINQNYLEMDIHEQGVDTREPILVIGNPPFGVSGNLALDFIKHSATFADTIAFILPLSFAKDSVMNKIPRNYHLNTKIGTGRGLLLDEDIFTLEGVGYSVPCVFQVWERRDYQRPIYKPKTKTDLFEFVSDVGESHCRIQRVGGNAGRAYEDTSGSKQSNYYIKLNKDMMKSYGIQDVRSFVDLVNGMTFDTVHLTVGPKSLSKTELITTLESSIKNTQGVGEDDIV